MGSYISSTASDVNSTQWCFSYLNKLLKKEGVIVFNDFHFDFVIFILIFSNNYNDLFPSSLCSLLVICQWLGDKVCGDISFQ